MHIQLTEKVKESIQLKRLSKNLLLICLAALQDKISHSKKKLSQEEEERLVLYRAARENGISKSEIIEKIERISKIDHPSGTKIRKIVDIYNGGDYYFDENFIPERLIHYKTDEEMRNDDARKAAVKKDDQIDSDLQKLITYIQTVILQSEMTSKMIKELKTIKTDAFSYKFILWMFKDMQQRIIKVREQKVFDSAFLYFKYVLSMIKNELPEGLQRYKKRERERQRMFDEVLGDWAKHIAEGECSMDEFIRMHGHLSEERLDENIFELNKRIEVCRRQNESGELAFNDKNSGCTTSYIHIFLPPKQKKLPPELEKLI